MQELLTYSVRLRSHAIRSFEVKSLLACTVLSLAALAGVSIDPGHPIGAFTKYLLGSLAVGVVPGLLLLAICLRQARLGLLDILALSVAISMSFAGVFTIISFTLHIPVSTLAIALPASCAVLSLLFLVSRSARHVRGSGWPRSRIYTVNLDPLMIALILATLVIIYLTSPPKPIIFTEDVLHMGVIKRVAAAGDPSIHNTFCCPGALYSYPFPSLHFFIAMVTAVSNLDPIFVYQKSRLFWCFASILAFFSVTKLFFRSNAIAYFGTLVAIILIYNGNLALVGDFYWGQLTPTSHNSDVAMNTLLPLAVMTLLYFVSARRTPDIVLFGAVNVLLFLTIGLAHPREIIQLLVYICVFVFSFLVIRFDKGRAIKSAVSLGLIAVVFGTYFLWLRGMHSVISGIVASRLAPKLEAIKGFAFADWFSLATNTQYFVGVLPTVFFLLFPTLLIVAIATVYVYRRRPFVVAAAMIILVFLMIIRFPFLAAPYVLATYHEILVSPVRNFVFFLYVLGGGAIYALYRMAADGTPRLSLRQPSHGLFAVAFISALAGLCARFANPLLMQFASIFIFILILSFAAVLLWTRFESGRPTSTLPGGLRHGAPAMAGRRFYLLPVLCAVGPVVALSTLPTESPVLALFRANAWTTPERALVQFYDDQMSRVGARDGHGLDAHGCLAPREESVWLPQYGDTTIRFPQVRTCVPSLDLVLWLRENIGADDVLAVNIFNLWWHLPFVESRLSYWSFGFLDPWHLFERYFAAGRKAFVERGEQPFYGPTEPPDERLAAIEALGVTHVVLDPDVYGSVIDQYRTDKEHFSLLYDDNDWAVVYAKQR